jgi:hypothetical protein
MTNTTADFSDDPIPRITRDMDDAGSGDVVMENVAALKAMFPSIVTDGQVDFDVLRQLLGYAVEDGANAGDAAAGEEREQGLGQHPQHCDRGRQS